MHKLAMFALSIPFVAIASPAGAQRYPAPTADMPQLMDMSLYCPVRPALNQIGLELGALPNDANGDIPVSYQLVQEIAREASWVQVFTRIHSGNAGPRVARTYRFTSEWQPYQPMHYYLYSYGSSQNAYAYNSDNFWLPVPASGQILASRAGPRWEGTWSSSVRVTGYLRRHRGLRCRDL